MPKPRAFYESLEAAVKPKLPSILTVEDGDYWKAVRQGAAPCFSVTNMKQVGALLPASMSALSSTAEYSVATQTKFLFPGFTTNQLLHSPSCASRSPGLLVCPQ